MRVISTLTYGKGEVKVNPDRTGKVTRARQIKLGCGTDEAEAVVTGR